MNTSTYFLFNISMLLEQYLHIQKQVTEHLQDLNTLTNVNVNINSKQDIEFIHKCNSDINDIFADKTEIISNLIEDITKQVKNNCNHEWVNDDIDLHLDQTMHIYYCNYCGLTKDI